MVYRRRTKKAKNLRRCNLCLIAGLFVFSFLCRDASNLAHCRPATTICKYSNLKIIIWPMINLSIWSRMRSCQDLDFGIIRGNWNNNFFFNNNQTRPDSLLPESKTPLPDDFHESSDTIKFVWLGHSTILISIGGNVILLILYSPTLRHL